MKLNLLVAVGGIGLLLSGCATSKNGTVLDRVGPAPASPPFSADAPGTLLVYSAYEVNADFNSRDPHRPHYSNYRILSTDGNLLQRVHNNSGTLLQRPTEVNLPPGTYSIVARANGYGTVTVPVLIAPGQETILHLEGGAKWPNPKAFNPANDVRLPDGDIVGWKSPVAIK